MLYFRFVWLFLNVGCVYVIIVILFEISVMLIFWGFDGGVVKDGRSIDVLKIILIYVINVIM